MNDHDVNERIIAYGWTDDGKSITGFYVLTETKRLLYTTKGELKSIEDRVEDKCAVLRFLLRDRSSCHSKRRGGIF